jgi:Zn-dependent protease with chaperone function
MPTVHREYDPATRTEYRETVVRRGGGGARAGLIVAIVAILAIIAAFAFGLIDINQTQEARAPEVSVSGGQAPAFDVDTAKVSVGSKATDVTVPKIDVGTTKEAVKVPTVSVEKAN